MSGAGDGGRSAGDGVRSAGNPALAPLAALENSARVLFAHAHPDDEALATGALIAHLAGRGVSCIVVTATRGERGEIRPGALPPGDTRSLTDVRATELAASCAVLGVSEHAWLGQGKAPYLDSGMQWLDAPAGEERSGAGEARSGAAAGAQPVAGPDPDAPPEAFTKRPIADAVADLVELIEAFQPEAIVSYDAAGTYGHPDHVHLHEVALRAANEAHLPMIEIVSERMGTPAPALPGFEAFPGTLSQVREALTSYATQLRVIALPEGAVDVVEVEHVGGQRQRVYCGAALAWAETSRS